MRLEAPHFWYGEAANPIARLLSPAASAYALASRLRSRFASAYVSRLPVFCAGNFTVGGAGKTPTAIALAALLKEAGRKPAFLTRGYRGEERGPHVVDPMSDTAFRVGDEALLLADHAPAIVSRDRAEGARVIEALGPDCIIMDDGFQNPTLHKDFCLVVVDAGAGFGNGRSFPAGPLRAPLARQLPFASAILVLGDQQRQRHALAARFAGLPVFEGFLRPAPDAPSLRGQRFVAFCGIGRPAKFYETLEAAGGRIVERVNFPDHHCFTDSDADRLLGLASAKGARLITTEKDAVRLTGARGSLATLKEVSLTLPVALAFEDGDEGRLAQKLADVLSTARQRAAAIPGGAR
jgi:tetraacyldisaccharide 4'-kinase